MNKHKLAWFWMTEAVIRMMTIVGVFFYAVVALIHDLLLIPQGPERMSRLVMLALQVAGILIFNSSRGLSVRAKSSLVPISAAVLELIPFFVTGGDRFYVFAALGFSILSFIYMSPLGLLIYMGFVNALLIPLIFIFRINVLGPGISRSREITEFLIFNVCSLMLYSISVLIWREVSDIDKTRKTFETVLETTPNYMVVTDENAETKYISKSLADWLGLADKRYAQDRPLLDLFRSGKITGIFQEILEQGGRVAREFNITQDGREYWFMLRSSPLEENQFSRLFEWVDVSSIMEAKNEAESAARAKSDFLANISHELRTPMNAIIGMADLLLTDALEAEQMTRVDTIKGAAISLLNIINDILDFSRIDTRKMAIIVQPFHFASLINDTVNMINFKTITANLVFTTAISKDIPPLINGDELRIKQCLINLLNNAVKFTSRGRIHLRAWPEYQEDDTLKLWFSVSDTGRGIKKEDLGKLFNEFQHLDTHKDRQAKGIGLGLAITSRLVELMEGALTIESEYGEGSTFAFYISCEKPPDSGGGPAAGVHQGKLAEVDHPETLRVLCFEPRPFKARAFRDMLNDLGVPCEVCVEINRARTLLRMEHFSHVFFDVSGKEKLKEFFGRPRTNFVVLKEVSEKYDRDIPNSLNRPILITTLADILNGKKDYQKRRIESCEEKTPFFMTRDVRILVVDDNPVNLTVTKGLLGRYGINVDTASGGEDAVEKVRRNVYDIVFMDHMMPGMDGLEATRVIRAMGGRFTQDIIIALTANAVLGVKKEFLDAGMNDFLAKPVIIKDLQEILKKYLPREKILSGLPK